MQDGLSNRIKIAILQHEHAAFHIRADILSAACFTCRSHSRMHVPRVVCHTAALKTPALPAVSLSSIL